MNCEQVIKSNIKVTIDFYSIFSFYIDEYLYELFLNKDLNAKQFYGKYESWCINDLSGIGKNFKYLDKNFEAINEL